MFGFYIFEKKIDFLYIILVLMLNWVLEGSVIKYELEISIDLYNILFIVVDC